MTDFRNTFIKDAGNNRDLATILSAFTIPLEKESSQSVFGVGFGVSRGLLIRLLFGHYCLKIMAKETLKHNDDVFVLTAIKELVDAIDFKDESWPQTLITAIGDII